MPCKTLTSNITSTDALLHDHRAVLTKPTGDAVTVLTSDAPALYAMTPTRLTELSAPEGKLSHPGSDVTLDDQFYEESQAVPVVMPMGRSAIYATWQPDIDFQCQAILWNVALREPVTTEELASFAAYQQAERKVFHHIQWQ